MNSLEFEKLGVELQQLAEHIPLQWGRIQNNATDGKVNLFACKNIKELETKTASLSNVDKDYFKRRWFLWQCSRCDEYLFYKHSEVTRNPNHKDQLYDIEFFNDITLRFDVKSTIVPKEMRSGFNMENPQKIVEFYYEKQSKGQRSNLQNRLFVIHHSFIAKERELILRCNWRFKEAVYKKYIDYLKNNSIILRHKNICAATIFIIEKQDGSLSFRFA